MSIQTNNHFRQEKFPEVFERALEVLHKHKSELTSTQYRYALGLIRGLELVENHANELIEISKETERNNRINDLTYLGAEPGLFPGSTPEQIQKSITIRVTNFVTAFEKSEEENDLLSFFIYSFVGAPCFNGRMITLEKYLCQRYGVKSELYYEKKPDLDKEAQELEELMYEYAEKHDLEEDIVPTSNQIRAYFQSMQGLSIKWKNLLQDKNRFASIYARACEFYVK